MLRLATSLAAVCLVAGATVSRADIFQWEYINPADPSQGKQQSTILAPGGAGVAAVPGAILDRRDLAKAYLIGANLTDALLVSTNLANADLGHANLTNADFFNAHLDGTDFSNAEIRGARFRVFFTGEFTTTQLYTTASYAARDLRGIRLVKCCDWAGANLADQNLSNASLSESYLPRANLTGANLTATSIWDSTLEGADLSGANLTGSSLNYSTFAGARFRGANLTNVVFNQPGLNGSDLTGADTRGGQFLDLPADVITTNLIRPDGHIHGLDLHSGGLLLVRDYEGNPNPVPVDTLPLSSPIPIAVYQHFTADAGGALRMQFEADEWNSTISFANGIPVMLGGTLELTFADDVNLASQVGRTFDLFDWTGVTPTNAFAVFSPYRWNLSNLYTTGEVTLTAVPEPGSLILAGLAALSLRAYRRDRS